MAETITLPGVGPVKRQYVILGAAGVAGILAVAYWRYSVKVAADAVDPVDAMVGESSVSADSSVGAPVQGNVQYAGTVTNDAGIPTTNAEWSVRAAELLPYDDQHSYEILGKFLARQPITPLEAVVVQAARAVAGEPPQGGPWHIVHALTPTPSPVPAPKLTKVWVGIDVAKGMSVGDFIRYARSHGWGLFTEGRLYSYNPGIKKHIKRGRFATRLGQVKVGQRGSDGKHYYP